MSDYTPPDALRLDLNFVSELKPVDSHNLLLNFGSEDGFSYANIPICTAFKVRAIGTVEPPIDVRGSANISINTGFKFAAHGKFDINHLLGVYLQTAAAFQHATPSISTISAPWAKPVFRAHNNAFYTDSSSTLSNQAVIGFEKAALLYRSVKTLHEQSTGLKSDVGLIWQETEKRFIGSRFFADVAVNLELQRASDWDELVRKRKIITYEHEVAHIFEKKFSYTWDRGLELVTDFDISWDKAKSIHYQKHKIKPWPKPEPERFTGSGDLNFTCLCTDLDSHNVILDFGADDCIPGLADKKWWYILNNLSVHRIDSGEKIKVLDGRYGTDKSSWCWSYNLTVPASEKLKLESVNGQPVVLSINVNGNEHHMLLESRTETRRFAQDTYSLTGRSQSALLDAPYSPVRSFLQENERTARQLCQAELDRVNSPIQLKWELINELSWILPANSLSYSGLTPIAAIKMIAESAGGFVYSEKSGQVITIKPKYKKTFWDSISVDEYDRLIPLSITTTQSIDDALYPHYNSITLTNDRSGVAGQVRRTGTAGDVVLETVNNPLFTVESMGGYGKSELAKAGLVETHSLTLPIAAEVGECSPADLTAFDAEWWGITDAVSVSFTHSVVTQSIKVERVKHE
ncbi:hypothetical protein [Acinetobacter sp. WCHAc010052]|uniref:hypothetical protein n=1 Tax=Acinetobacter sp. WCHAc010052 TaxID=2004647 RepID=UPI000B3CDD09|nr:hypothetical protein [Acinetobacter sp. WCHAc010052]AXY60177.1 hypothetical protein CDG61_09150 [Acinetobacter sp. WCHAc010052]